MTTAVAEPEVATSPPVTLGTSSALSGGGTTLQVIPTLTAAAVPAVVSRSRDVSHYQGVVNWVAERARDHITWAMCKATQGLLYTDPTFAANYAGMRAAGLVRGGYHYADPSQSATKQAARFVAMVKPVAGVDFLCLDLEAAPASMTQSEVRAWRQEFSAAIRKLAPGVSYGIYIGGYAHNGSGEGIGPDECDWWMFPRYASMGPTTTWPTTVNPDTAPNMTGFPRPHVHQFSPSVYGYDASVSTLTAAQIADPQGALSMSDVQTILNAIANLGDVVLTGNASQGSPKATLAQWLTEANIAAKASRDALAALTPATIAAAVVAELPTGEGGTTFTPEQVAQVSAAVAAVFAKAGATS